MPGAHCLQSLARAIRRSVRGRRLAIKKSADPSLVRHLQHEAQLLQLLAPLAGTVVPRLVGHGATHVCKGYWVATGAAVCHAADAARLARGGCCEMCLPAHSVRAASRGPSVPATAPAGRDVTCCHLWVLVLVQSWWMGGRHSLTCTLKTVHCFHRQHRALPASTHWVLCMVRAQGACVLAAAGCACLAAAASRPAVKMCPCQLRLAGMFVYSSMQHAGPVTLHLSCAAHTHTQGTSGMRT
jgi:hypothetical protein